MAMPSHAELGVVTGERGLHNRPQSVACANWGMWQTKTGTIDSLVSRTGWIVALRRWSPVLDEIVSSSSSSVRSRCWLAFVAQPARFRCCSLRPGCARVRAAVNIA